MPSTSTLDSKSNPHDVLEIAPDIVLVARAAAELPSLVPDTAHRPNDRQPDMESGFAADPVMSKVDTSFRATDTSGGRARRGWARKLVVAFMFAVCSALAAAWERYGDDAQSTVAGIAPQILPALMSWLPEQKSASTEQPASAPATETSAVSQTTPSPAPAAHDTTAAAAASPVSSGTADQAELLQSMARDVAGLTQQMDELKATVAQLKSAQEQMSREKARPEARISEARPIEPRPTKLGAPPRPLGTLVQRARPPAYPPQAAYAPAPLPPPSAAPVQIAPPPPAAAQPDGEPVMRPPMPVR